MSKLSHQELKSISHKQFKADILAELRKQTTLLEVIAKQGERTLDYISTASDPVTGAEALGLPG